MEEKSTEIIQETKEESLLTFQISNGKKTKTVRFKKRQLYALCLATVVIVISCILSLVFCISAKRGLSISTQKLKEVSKTKVDLEEKTTRLETENQEYHKNITELQNKATEIENKILELDNIKKSLSDKLELLSQHDNSEKTIYAILVSDIQGAQMNVPLFTSIIQTSYSRPTTFSAELDQLKQKIDTDSITFLSIAGNVTHNLARPLADLATMITIPSGAPCGGRVTSEFNPSGNPSISDGRVHKGIDIATSLNHPVQATADGQIEATNYEPGYGNYLKIDHGYGFKTLYAHNTKINCSVGDKVKKGTVVAFAGSTGKSTGVHVHYEVILNGIHQNPRDYF